MKRTDEQWVHELQDATNPDVQLAANQELHKYLTVVVHHYLRQQATTFNSLNDLSGAELDKLARGSAHDTLLKNDFTLLEKYTFQHRFLSWAAKVAVMEARRHYRE